MTKQRRPVITAIKINRLRNQVEIAINGETITRRIEVALDDFPKTVDTILLTGRSKHRPDTQWEDGWRGIIKRRDARNAGKPSNRCKFDMCYKFRLPLSEYCEGHIK